MRQRLSDAKKNNRVYSNLHPAFMDNDVKIGLMQLIILQNELQIHPILHPLYSGWNNRMLSVFPDKRRWIQIPFGMAVHPAVIFVLHPGCSRSRECSCTGNADASQNSMLYSFDCCVPSLYYREGKTGLNLKTRNWYGDKWLKKAVSWWAGTVFSMP